MAIISGGNTQEDLAVTDIEMKLMEIRRNLECGDKAKLEMDHSVCINAGALDLVCDIVGRCFHAMWSDDGGESSNNSPETVVLHRRAVRLLEEACLRVRQNLNTNEDEKRMEEGEYFLYRALVELEETMKEKERASRYWVPHVQKEYNGMLNAWDTLISKWKKLLTSCGKPQSKAQKINKLVEIRAGLIEVESEFKIRLIYELLKDLGTTMNQLIQSSSESFKKHLSVTPRIVAEVASPITGIPPSWLLNLCKPPLVDLREGLQKILAVQTHAITVITNALSRQRPPNRNGSRPIGSFLLLSDFVRGRLELAEALANQLYDDQCQVMSFDISDDKDLHEYEGIVGGKLIEGVKNRPYSVLVLENFDGAKKRTIEAVQQIIEGGRLIDSQGITVDFSKTLILVNSDVGKEGRGPVSCNCLDKERDLPIKSQIFCPDWEKSHGCEYLPVFREARIHFEDKLYNEVDDIVIFNRYSFQTERVFARSQLRDIPKKIKQERLILYPSEAALQSIIMKSHRSEIESLENAHGEIDHEKVKIRDFRKAVRSWLEENIVHRLFKVIADNEIKEVSVVYIDVLVGTSELSYRLKRGGPEEDMYFWHLKNSLKVARTIYKKEKRRINCICSLRESCFRLINMMHSKASTTKTMVQQICSLLDLVIANEVVRFKCKEDHKLVPLKSLNKEALRHIKISPKVNYGGRSSKCYREIDFVREAFLKFINEPQNRSCRPIRSFLFLGLSRVGKVDLAKSLAESFATDDGTDVVIKINMQEYTEPESLLQLTDHIFGPLLNSDNEQHGSRLPEAVIPCHVLLIDEVEKANMTVFGALIALLDHGTLRDNQGRIFDFSNIIVVIMSHLGNNEMLAKLVRVNPGAGLKYVGNEEGGRRFRTELLNCIDEIVMVNPFTREQLNKVARLPMKYGRHLVDTNTSSTSFALRCLFIYSDDPLLKTDREGRKFARLHLKLGLVKGRKNDVVVS